MAKKKSIFSFLMKKDAPAERNAKTDGKGVYELSAQNNEDISKTLSRQEKNETPQMQVVEQNKKERFEKHQKNNSLQLKEPKQSQKKHKKQWRKRYLELNNDKNKANEQIKAQLKKSTQLKDSRYTDNKAILDFIKNLDPEVQQHIADNLKQKAQAQVIEQKNNRLKFDIKEKDEQEASVHDKIVQKRGIKPTGRLAVLKTAKKIAEKARQAVKNFRQKVLSGQSIKPKQQKGLANFSKRQNKER